MSQKLLSQLNKKQNSMCKTCDKKLSPGSNKERRLKKSREKCPEDREKSEDLPKCPRPKRSRIAKAKKCLTRTEKIMLRIQPPIADRERYLHPEHVNCFLEESERVYIKKPECAPCPSEREKVCNEDKKKKTKKTTANENVEGEKAEGETTDNGGEKDVEFSPAEQQEGEENIEVEGNKQSSEDSKAKSQANKNKKKKNKKKRKRKEDIEEDSDEMSICSNDSEICLVGLGLTKEDKKNIEENRRKVHPPPDNKENNSESGKDVQEVSEQEGEDKK